MNTEQLKTAEEILKENLKNIHFQQADSTFYDVISAMNSFASQESKRAVDEFKEQLAKKGELDQFLEVNQKLVHTECEKAVSEFKEKLKKDYEDRILLCENVIKQNPEGWPTMKAICEGVITEYRYLIDKTLNL